MKKGSFGTVGKSAVLHKKMRSIPVGGEFMWPERPAPYVAALNLGYVIRTIKTNEGYIVRRLK